MDVNLQTNATYGAASRPSSVDVSVSVAPQVSTATNQPERTRERDVVNQAPTAPAVSSTRQSSEEQIASPATTLSEEDVSDFMIERAFSDANRALAGGSFRLSYGIHQATNRITVAVYDSQTDELIREVPSESRLDLYARITEFTGLLFDSSS